MEPKLGDVYRISDNSPFMDATIHRVNTLKKTVTLARPYCYASETGAPLVGVEMIQEIPFSLLASWVLKSSNYAR